MLVSSPARTKFLEHGVTGTRLVLRGRQLDASRAPIAGAVLDVWQADETGAYDRVAFRLPGHQIVDADWRRELTTIVPSTSGLADRALKTGLARLQLLSALELCEIFVECAEWKMPGLASRFEDKTVGETEGWLAAEVLESCGYNIGVVQRE